MSETPYPPAPLNRPPGYKDPYSPVDHPGFRPPPRKPVLPPSFQQQEEKSSCCRVCCCFFCIFFSILLVLIIAGTAIFYFYFNPKPPNFHVKSFKISSFNVTATPNGTQLNAITTTVIEVKNPNGKMTYYYGNTVVYVSVGEGADETALGTTKVPKFTSRTQNTKSLKVETKASNKTVDVAVANRLLAQFEAKSLSVNVAAKTKIGVGLEGLKIGMLAGTVKCKGIAMKQIGDAPKCVIHTLKWINVR